VSTGHHGAPPANKPRIVVSLREQRLRLYRADGSESEFAVSTAANGPGEQDGSGCTPRGLHQVRLRIGAGCPEGTVFVSRRPTGETWSPELAAQHPGRDWILTRILWLTGCEPARNRRGRVDTLRRYIYLHGCPDDAAMGVALSHGCIRMRNRDIVALFDLVPVGTEVLIEE
jgi:lipoprotein-anchoring transpeptidase ErfK/SrfK